MQRPNFLPVILSVTLLALTAACGNKLQNDCVKFDKNFLDACNASCPSKCVQMASQSKQVTSKFSTTEIQEKCKTSCTKHCGLQLEKVRPPKCKKK